MLYYRRRLPHWIPDHAILFVTWRLAGSAPLRPQLLAASNTGRLSFTQRDRLLAGSPSGPFWLRDPRLASLVVETLRCGEESRGMYVLHAWVVMPDHVHVVWEPRLELPRIMCWLKGRTARRANQMLGKRGLPFWQDEFFDHWVRTEEELKELVGYVECNPVEAGLVGRAEQWPWSSASRMADGSERRVAPNGGPRKAMARPT